MRDTPRKQMESLLFGSKLLTGRQRKGWLLLLIAGFLAPMLILSWYTSSLQRASLEQAYRLEFEQRLRIFTQGMVEPIWNLIPDSGEAAIASLMEDDRVIAVEVFSSAQGWILGSTLEGRRHGETIVFSEPAMRDGAQIGSVRIEIDITHLQESLISQSRNTILVLAIQVVLGLVVAVLVIRVFRRLERQEVVEKANQRLQEEVEERRQTERELTVAKSNAEEASQAKTRFLANMSHELRTPLNAVIGFSDIISHQRMGPVGQQRYVEYATDINDAASHLLKIISDILDIARTEGGNAKILEDSVDMRDLLNSCTRLMDSELKKKRQIVEIDCTADLPLLRADSRFLKQIVINLLSNSIKFTPDNGRIEASGFADKQNRILICVRDNGVGMTKSEIGIALDPFGQINADHTLSRDGVGLGLPIAKKLAEQHGAEFRIESDRGVGTTITVIFPADRTLWRVITGKSVAG